MSHSVLGLSREGRSYLDDIISNGHSRGRPDRRSFLAFGMFLGRGEAAELINNRRFTHIRDADNHDHGTSSLFELRTTAGIAPLQNRRHLAAFGHGRKETVGILLATVRFYPVLHVGVGKIALIKHDQSWLGFVKGFVEHRIRRAPRNPRVPNFNKHVHSVQLSNHLTTSESHVAREPIDLGGIQERGTERGHGATV
jgi:hypothetical protein